MALLNVRQEQIWALRGSQVDMLVERFAAYLAFSQPRAHAELGDAGARELVREAIRVGLHHGIDRRGAALGLAELMLEFGPQFECSPDQGLARELLEDPSVPGDVKVAAMKDCLRARTRGRTLVRLH